jgi:hypothetical protein
MERSYGIILLFILPDIIHSRDVHTISSLSRVCRNLRQLTAQIRSTLRFVHEVLLTINESLTFSSEYPRYFNAHRWVFHRNEQYIIEYNEHVNTNHGHAKHCLKVTLFCSSPIDRHPTPSSDPCSMLSGFSVVTIGATIAAKMDHERKVWASFLSDPIVYHCKLLLLDVLGVSKTEYVSGGTSFALTWYRQLNPWLLIN